MIEKIPENAFYKQIIISLQFNCLNDCQLSFISCDSKTSKKQ